MGDEVTSITPRPEWTPGTLTTTQLNGVLIDALADLWADTYRHGRHYTLRQSEFKQRLENLVNTAIGHSARLGR